MVEDHLEQQILRMQEELESTQALNAALENENAKLREENEDLHLENEDLFEREALVRNLIEEAPDAFFVHDLGGNFVFVNEMACVALGYDKEELMQMSVADVEYGLTPDQIHAFWDEVLAGRTVQSEGLLRRKDGMTFPADIRIGLFEVSGNQVVYGVGRDITERKQLEDRLRQANKMEAVGTLAGGIAHDFNNILGIILGCAELAGDPLDETHPTQEYLDEIKLVVLRAKEVIRQLLSFSQKSDEPHKLLRIDPLVKESLNFMRATIPANIELRSTISDDCFRVMANSAQIHQVIINLCANAAHAVRDGGTVEVDLRNQVFDADQPHEELPEAEGLYLQMTVKDTGCGISPEHIERIFDPYFTTKDVGKGSGMGLAVVHGIVQSLGGIVKVKSELGQGTAVFVLLPAKKGHDEVEMPADFVERSLPMGIGRIMVVDDEILIVNGLKERLEGLGYAVEGFLDPTDALAAIRDTPDQFDLLMTDMAMPKMTGTSLIDEVKNIREDLPVILCTGFSQHIEGRSPQEIGAEKILLKPIDRQELAHSVSAVLNVQEDGDH